MPVPYRSGGELATAVLTQATDTSIGDFAAMIPLVREGRLRALAVTSSERTPLAPDIPTMTEAGVPDYDVTTFFGVVAPAGTPDEIVRMLNNTLNEGLKTPEAQALIQRIGVVSQPGTPQEFAAFIAAKRQRWGAAAKAIGVKDRTEVGNWQCGKFPFSSSAAGRSASRSPASSAGAASPASWSSRATAPSSRRR